MSQKERGRADAALAVVDLHGSIHFAVGIAAATGIVDSAKDTLYGDIEIAYFLHRLHVRPGSPAVVCVLSHWRLYHPTVGDVTGDYPTG